MGKGGGEGGAVGGGFGGGCMGILIFILLIALAIWVPPVPVYWVRGADITFFMVLIPYIMIAMSVALISPYAGTIEFVIIGIALLSQKF